MGKLSYEASEQTKTEILKSATVLFASKGYYGSTMEAIAKTAGVNKALLYYHFKNKPGLYNAIFLQMIFAVRNAVETALAADERERSVSIVLQDVAAVLSKEPKFSALLLSEIIAGGVNLEERTLFEIRTTLGMFVKPWCEQRGETAAMPLGMIGALHFLNIATPMVEKLGLFEGVAKIPLPVAFAETIDTLLQKDKTV